MTSYKTKPTPGDTSWFTHDRFGMFIHFGLYALPARHEQIKFRERITEEKYQKYFDNFNPNLYNANEWAKKAKAAGMKYAVITTKHHDGFCLFDSKYTEYKSTNTPCHKDIVKEYVDAFRAEGLHIGFYYSLIDWHHPDFVIDAFHPRSLDPDAPELDKNRDMKKYAEYMRNQVTELLTNYGKIDILWFDFSYKAEDRDKNGAQSWMRFNGGKSKNEWEAEELIKTARAIQPNIIIDNRTQIEQDIYTPEQYLPTEWVRHPQTNELVVWETCHTLSGSWGYHRDEQTWKSPDVLLNMLITAVSAGGNLLMNIGPTSRGFFDYRAEKALKVYENWMKYNSRSIYGCTKAEPEFTAPLGTRLTQSVDSKRLYIHLLEYPCMFMRMQNLADKIDYAQFLHDGSEILYTFETPATCNEGGYETGDNLVTFSIPAIKPEIVSVPVIEVFLK